MIYVECKPDLALVRAITEIPRKEIIHEGGKSEVCRRLEKRMNCKGLVDEDPQSSQPPYIRRMKEERDLSKHKVKILHDNSNENYLVVLCPRLEEWILEAAKEANIDVRNYNLPDDPAKLHEEINFNLKKLEELIKALRNFNRLKTLKRLLEGGEK